VFQNGEPDLNPSKEKTVAEREREMRTFTETLFAVMLLLGSTYALTKDEVKKQLPNACYTQWIQDNECDSRCGELDSKDCSSSSRFSETKKIDGKPTGFTLTEDTKVEHNTKNYYISHYSTKGKEREEQILRRGLSFTIEFPDEVIVGYQIKDQTEPIKCDPVDEQLRQKYKCDPIPYNVKVGRHQISLIRADAEKMKKEKPETISEHFAAFWKDVTNFFKGEKKEEGTIIVLFNPWLKESPVYMKDDNERREYVMEQSGAY